MRPFLLWRGTTGLSLGTRFPREMRGGEGTAEATAHLSGDHPNGRERSGDDHADAPRKEVADGEPPPPPPPLL